MPIPTMRETKDSELVTVEAIQFRIEKIKRECGGTLTAGASRRIAALRLRLPKKEGAPVAEAVNCAILVDKSKLTWGDRG